MTVDRWAQAVRQQLGVGRVLPLGGPGDGAWIVEPAAQDALRRAVAGDRGVRLGALRLGPADPEGTYESTVPAPPSALPAGPLRIEAECAATVDEPLPVAAARLRAALSQAAADRLGLLVTEVDLQVTALLDEAPDPEAAPERPEPEEQEEQESTLTGDEGRVARAALSVPGVSRLTGVLGGIGRAIHIEERAGAGALPRRHVRVELAVGPGHRALDVTGVVREAVATALPDDPTVSVLVTSTAGRP
ncbi:nucleopolyhedrovirus P10 family protein [Streptomyces sp. NPDC050095]|uniref:nucleopolyhedrovirus P10 family protein n=1 Tax=unclassified Streptomyces TaxID=2593676 RepID=UPI00342F36D7